MTKASSQMTLSALQRAHEKMQRKIGQLTKQVQDLKESRTYYYEQYYKLLKQSKQENPFE